MYHLDNTSGVPEMPEPKDQQSVTPRWFGESQEQGGISWPGADWFNTVQAELLNLLNSAGIVPDKNTFDQLSKAIPVLGDARIRKELMERGGARIPVLLQGGTVQDAIPEVFPVAFGADPTGETSSTAAIQAALAEINRQTDSTFNSDITKYQRLKFPEGIFRASGLLIKSNVIVECSDNTVFLPEPGADYVWDTVGTEPYSFVGSAKRLFRPVFRNLKIGYGFQNKFDGVVIAENVGGIRLAHGSYAVLDNVEMRYLDGHALTGESVWDSDFNNVRIMYCGNTRDPNNIKYALNFNAGNDPYDGSNALRFWGVHIEGCPAMMCLDKRSRHIFFFGGKLEYFRNNDPATYASSILRGVDGVHFFGTELSWSNIAHRMFKSIGTTVMQDTSADDTSDYESDHSRGIELNGVSIIDSQNLPGDYFEYSSKRGPLVITGGYARHARYIISGSDFIWRGMVLTQCGPYLGNLIDNNLVDNLTVNNHRILPGEAFSVFSVSGKNNLFRNSYFSTPYGSNNNGCAWIQQSAVAGLGVENVVFGGKFQWGIKGAPSAFQFKKFKNLRLEDGADYGEIVQGGFSVDGFPTQMSKNSGGAVTDQKDVSADSTLVIRDCIKGGCFLTIRIENSSSVYLGTAMAHADFASATMSLLSTMGMGFSVTGTGVTGDGKVYLSSSGGNLTVTNRTTSGIKVYVATINAKM